MSKYISIKDSIPNKFTAVLVVVKDCTGQPYYAAINTDGDWIDLLSGNILIDVIAWREIPKPSKKEIKKFKKRS